MTECFLCGAEEKQELISVSINDYDEDGEFWFYEQYKCGICGEYHWSESEILEGV